MRYWFRGKRGGLLAFLVIAALVAGGLGWVTAAAWRLEQEQLEARAGASITDKLRLALWRLDSLVSPALAKENSRPYNHYSAVFPPPLAFSNDGTPAVPGSVLEPSPLLNADLPDWMVLHFQAAAESGWASPQVLSATLVQRLHNARVDVPSANVTPERARLLSELSGQLPPDTLLAAVQQRGTQLLPTDMALMPPLRDGTGNYLGNSNNEKQQQVLLSQQPPAQQAQMVDPEYLNRASQRAGINNSFTPQKDDLDVACSSLVRNGEDWFLRSPVRKGRSEQVPVTLGPMVPLWLDSAGQERLVLARLVQIGNKQVCQGILLDWPRLRTLLTNEVADLFPEAETRPVREELSSDFERTMTALPLQLDPGPGAGAPAAAGWTPLRIGLALAWVAALVALLAVGLGGWSLLDLSERRIRFVSAVTHELRTPLTTLRLYLDMLAGGMVKEEKQKTEYLHTLNAEADRLNRLVGNVLDFSRLENQRPRLARTSIPVADLLEQVCSTWQGRCQGGNKELVVENTLGAEARLFSDLQLVQQILGNLIDNACKYSRDAADRRIWLRARARNRGTLLFEVEDRGPGVPPRERRSIFRPFRRGRGVEVTAGGVGLGLALAQRWASLLGGRLTLRPGADHVGACFRLELPS
jgi:signal transduction histidine kinase